MWHRVVVYCRYVAQGCSLLPRVLDSGREKLHSIISSKDTNSIVHRSLLLSVIISWLSEMLKCDWSIRGCLFHI